MKEYLNKILAKNYIRKSEFLVKNLVLFIFKKRKEQWFYINYRTLNTVTKKDRYLLPLTNELKNQFTKVKIYMKLNLRNIYYFIKIAEKEK